MMEQSASEAEKLQTYVLLTTLTAYIEQHKELVTSVKGRELVWAYYTNIWIDQTLSYKAH